jgi:outer membrane protein assembly factor BamB
MRKVSKSIRPGTVAIFAAAVAMTAVGANFGLRTASGGETPAVGTAAWPMLGRDREHTGRSNIDSRANAGNLKWQYKASGWVASSPVIGTDGTIYVGNDDTVSSGGGQSAAGGGNLYAVNPDGTLKWKLPINGSTQRISPAIGPDGSIYIRSENISSIFGHSYLYAVHPDGSLNWKFKIGVASGSAVIGSDGTIYIGDGDGDLYAINPSGWKKWRFNIGTASGFEAGLNGSTPAVGNDGTIYAGSCDKNLYAITAGGDLKWKFPTDGEVCYSVPSIGSDGTIFVGSTDNNIYAINPDGTLKWKFASRAWAGSPGIDAAETVYFGSGSELYALDSKGKLKWHFPLRSSIGMPLFGADGTIYVTSGSNVDALAPDGSLKWMFGCGCGGDMSPSAAIGADGTIYAGSEDGNLYAVRDTVTSADVPPSFNLGAAAVGDEIRKGFAIKNTGKATLFVQGENISCSGEFEDVASQCSAAPGDLCTITLRFKPKEAGKRTTIMTINDNADAGYQTVTLIGVGQGIAR